MSSRFQVPLPYLADRADVTVIVYVCDDPGDTAPSTVRDTVRPFADTCWKNRDWLPRLRRAAWNADGHVVHFHDSEL